jgi:hypothetical protein
MNYVDRPTFAEGQLLSASELELVVDYARDALEAHDRYAHTSGVVEGLVLATQPAAAGAGTPVAIVVTPGFAVDGQGRQIEIVTQMTLPSDSIAGLPSNPYPAFVWTTDNPLVPTAAADPCRTVVERTRETVHVGVFADAATATAQAPSAVCLGNVAWDTVQQSFVPLNDSDPRDDPRRRAGVRASEIVAPEHRVIVHADDAGGVTMAVKGAVQAVAADDGTLPIVGAPGGAMQFSPAIPPGSLAPTPAATMSLSYLPMAATGNGLVLDLGNSDPNSQFVIEKHGSAGPGSGTPVASISAAGNGTISVANGAFTSVAATANVVVGSGPAQLSIQAMPPTGAIGIGTAGTLSLAFGPNPGNAAVFLAGATPAATIDAHTVTVNEKSVALGTIDAASGLAGVATMATDRLVLGTKSNDVDIAPALATLLRFTSANTVLNMAAGGCDVTPVTGAGASQSSFRLGPISVAYGTATVTLHPLADVPPVVTFPAAFSAVPAFFVSAYASGHFTVSASATNVSTTGATYKVVRLNPFSPSDGNAAAYSNTTTTVKVSWLALGVA